MADKEIKVFKKIVWKLSDMTKEKIEAYKFDETLESPSLKIVFRDNVTEWFLRFYPGGYTEKFEDSMSFCLMLKGAYSKSFKIDYTLGIIGKNENVEWKCERQGEPFRRGCGTKALLKRSDFLNPDLGYLIDGKVQLYCNLTISAKDVPKNGKKALLYQNQIDKFKRMFDEEIHADFELHTSDGKVLKAHKSVLAVGSTYFHGVLTNAMKETKENAAKVTEDSVIMKEVLRFIYSSEVDNLDSIAYELVFAAEKYQLDGLKEICFDNIIKTLTPENVLQSLMATDRLTKTYNLEDKCVEMIANNFQFVSDSEDWKKLPQSLILEITRRVSEDKGIIFV